MHFPFSVRVTSALQRLLCEGFSSRVAAALIPSPFPVQCQDETFLWLRHIFAFLVSFSSPSPVCIQEAKRKEREEAVEDQEFIP